MTTTVDRSPKQLTQSTHGTEVKPGAGLYPDPNAKPLQGRYGSHFPKTVVNGFTLICPIKPGHANNIREAGARIAT